MKKSQSACVWIAGVCSLLMIFTGHAVAAIKLPMVISSHMVLQRDTPVPIWGTAAPDEKVTVKFRDQEKSTIADKSGKWMVKLDPMKVGEPGALTITGTNTIALGDVVVGEVWVGSGQSNMGQTVNEYLKADPGVAKIAGESHPQIRIAGANSPWRLATPASVKGFSALMLSFGVPLQKDLNVPVGLLVGAVGGTPSGFWVSKEMLDADPAVKAAAAKAEAANPFEPRKKKYDVAMEKYKADLTRFEELVAAAKRQAAAATQPGAASTQPVKIPDPKSAPPKPPLAVPAGESQGGPIGHLYEIHIRPMVPYAIRGVLWDQGEAGSRLEGIDQFVTMGALIRGWRGAWGQGDFPFIYVQKPSGGGAEWGATKVAPLPGAVPTDGGHREEYIRLMTYPKTTMVISSDLGGGTHPTRKSAYGERASRVALGVAYAKEIEYSGPLFSSVKIEDTKIKVTFTHVGKGLVCPEGQRLQGFAVAGEDKIYHWADAVIEGDSVVLSCAKVNKPVTVRYAWSPTHPWANLFNKDGFPAIPFRTDR